MNLSSRQTSVFFKGGALLILAQIMVGVNIVSSKHLLSFAPVWFLLMMRFTLAAIILLPLHWLSSARSQSVFYYFSQISRREWWFILAQALSAGILFNFLMLLGLNYTDANVAGIITSTLPAIIAVMSWLILGERISGKKSLCILFATIGLILIACDKFQGLGDKHFWGGDLLILCSLLPEASYYILCKIHPNRLPVFLISSLMNAINAVLLGILCFWMPMHGFSIGSMEWGILLILGLSSGLFYVFWFWGCQCVDGMMASLSTAVMPVATVLLAWLFLHELLTMWQFIGMALVMLSIMLYAKP